MGQALRGQRSWTDLGLLLLCEVIFDVEGLPDFLGGLSFDHVGHRLTGDVQQAFNVQVISRLKEKAKEAVLKLLPEHYQFARYVRLGFRLLEVKSSASVCCLISCILISAQVHVYTEKSCEGKQSSINKLRSARYSRERQKSHGSGQPPHCLKKKHLFTRISSNKVPWSTLRNSWSQTGMSSVLFSLFSSSSGGGGSSLWWVHH